MSVSVWMPSFCHAGTIGRAIASVLAQPVHELLILDDHSTDGSLPLALAYAAKDSRVTVKVQPIKAHGVSWEPAAYREALTLTGQHIISLSADDWLLPGTVDSVQRHVDDAVIFHDYLVCDHLLSKIISNVQCGMHRLDSVSFGPREAQMRIEQCQACESGIGSSIRSDCLRWLCDLEFWAMGPYADAIGYAAVAAFFGAAYSPHVAAVFTDNPGGYGARMRNDPDRRAGLLIEVDSFLKRTGLPPEVQRIIKEKRDIA